MSRDDLYRSTSIKLTRRRALDFLFLSYSPLSSISTLLPSSLMTKYQKVHNFLLRISRVDTVIRTLYWDVLHQSEPNADFVKVGVDRGLKRQPSEPRTARATKAILMSGSKIEHRLHRLRFRMSHFIAVLSRYVLDTAIGANWDVMRRRLERLKRRSSSREESYASTSLLDQDDTFDFTEVENDDDRRESLHEINQLQSIHSLVIYHHLTLDRILRACLLSPHAGYQVTFKVLMALLGLVLDCGKLVKEVDRGVVSFQEGEDKIVGIASDWEEKEAVFVRVSDPPSGFRADVLIKLHALERLSLRTTESQHHNELEQDLRLLLRGESTAGTGDESALGARGVGPLQELLLRLRLSSGSDKGRGGRWKSDGGAV